jgi:hypothetical protein
MAKLCYARVRKHIGMEMGEGSKDGEGERGSAVGKKSFEGIGDAMEWIPSKAFETRWNGIDGWKLMR